MDEKTMRERERKKNIHRKLKKDSIETEYNTLMINQRTEREREKERQLEVKTL